jgi:hypothetical protein
LWQLHDDNDQQYDDENAHKRPNPHRPHHHRDSSTCRALLHIAAALVVGFLGQRAVELCVFHFTAAFVHLLASYSASDLLLRGKCCRKRHRENYSSA